ncbi:hypothetical protein [Corynebacterium sp. A21]|uniref:hypothetical protein n=1 Tax=Corynebacterium sp. A21 TaxID=3457318 RepID=UPI003FD1C019
MMTREEVTLFLAQIQAVDNRTITAETVTAWHDAATRQKWTMDYAVEGMRRHFSESTDWLMPGHITQRIRTIRRDQQPPLKALPAAPESASDRAMRDKVMARYRNREVHTS